MKAAIALLAYTRDVYFELTLTSLLNQSVLGYPVTHFYDVYIFQDGLGLNASAADLERHSRIRRLVGDIDAGITFIPQEHNLGIAMHFDFIEKYLFERKGYEVVGFFEDDLILAPGYLHAFKLLQDKFQHDPRVGMFSAVPVVYQRPLKDQLDDFYGYDHMGHSWAFGISREFWIRRQVFVEKYLEFVRGIPYGERPHQKIFDWLEANGVQPKASSQDYVKQYATAALGGVRISTKPNYGLYIGRDGEHCTQEIYERLGYKDSVICDRELDHAGDLDEAHYLDMLREQRRNILTEEPENFFTPEEIKSSYKIFFGRDPESNAVINDKRRKTRQNLLRDLITSDEFLSKKEHRSIISEANKKLASSK